MATKPHQATVSFSSLEQVAIRNEDLCLVVALVASAAAGSGTLIFEDAAESCSIKKSAGSKLSLSTGCCIEDDCSKSLADRVTAIEGGLTAVQDGLLDLNQRFAASLPPPSESPTPSPTAYPTPAGTYP
jgi:hypothetical protein